MLEDRRDGDAEVGVSASPVYRSKQAHRRAVQCLASDIATIVDDEATLLAELTAADGTTHGNDDSV